MSDPTPTSASGPATPRLLRIAAAVEAASLAVLFLNLFTVHAKVVTSLMGPVHGMAYLVTFAAVWQAPGAAGSGARWRAAVPGIGGLLALARLRAPQPPRACRNLSSPSPRSTSGSG
ncbi:DUF3817 domain-containing protein [Streptomyces sp. NPDC091292]|uniref:DUF3817 domain-containing protein n=1 Tax=Streptomyces sp. NPDC091292 TaxID=3365991 RepID=UPI003812B64D